MSIKGILVALVAFVLLGSVGLVVLATGDSLYGDETESGSSGLMDHVHAVGMKLHGVEPGHHGDHASHFGPMMELLDRLELNDDQQARFAAIHQGMGAFHHGDPAGMRELHEVLMQQFDGGKLETEQIHGLIDEHLAQIRSRAVAVTDEMVTLINDLDDRQRDVLREHLQELHGHGH